MLLSRVHASEISALIMKRFQQRVKKRLLPYISGQAQAAQCYSSVQWYPVYVTITTMLQILSCTHKNPSLAHAL